MAELRTGERSRKNSVHQVLTRMVETQSMRQKLPNWGKSKEIRVTTQTIFSGCFQVTFRVIFSECFPHVSYYIRLMFFLKTSILAILKMFSLIWTGVSLGQQHSGQCGISLHHHPEKFSLLSYSPYLLSFIHLPVQLFSPTAS